MGNLHLTRCRQIETVNIIYFGSIYLKRTDPFIIGNHVIILRIIDVIKIAIIFEEIKMYSFILNYYDFFRKRKEKN